MPDISREQIEKTIQRMVKENQIDPDDIVLDDLTSIDGLPDVDLKALFSELGALKSEIKQINRLEKKRTELLNEFVENEKRAKDDLRDNIAEVARQKEFQGLETVIHSLIGLRDFVESFRTAVPKVLECWNNPVFMWQKKQSESQKFVNANINGILKKIDAILEKHQVRQIPTDNEIFNPDFMTVVDTGYDGSLDENCVIETFLRGYVCQNSVIRYATVKVNKKPMSLV